MRVKVWGVLITLLVIFQSDALLGLERPGDEVLKQEKDPFLCLWSQHIPIKMKGTSRRLQG